MRPLLLVLLVLACAAPAVAQRLGATRGGEQDQAYRAMNQGEILPLGEIRARINVPGARFIGVEFDGRIYRLKFMRGSEMIWIDVDARTGRVVGRQ
ncbi:PepSY domain-containing protein [Sphingosinicella sp.]|uniref:PepSY domain-containing protein n=1 Tax=Sphingosinicella sp. TaxID=1917971 RepID=UPI0040382D33